MKKNYFIIIFLTLVILIISGCSNADQKIRDNQENEEQNLEQKVGDDKISEFEDRFVEASISDLVVGEKVLVMGVENVDKSILASRIIIGGEDIDFKEMVGSRSSGEAIGQREIDHDEMPPADFQGQSPNFEDFSEMSDEEKEEFREKMMQGREGMDRTNGSVASSSATRLNGEILSQDETGLTLKLEEGGSRIVFFSESIEFKKTK